MVFTGSVPWAELPAHYAAGDVFAMPCRTRSRGLDVEGLGIVYLEASATGLPVVAGDSGGAPDAVREGETGYVVGGRDVAAIADRLADAADRPRPGAPAMGAAGPGLGRAGVALGDPGRADDGPAARLTPVRAGQQARIHSAGPGSPKCQPWPASQPMSRRRSAWPAVSTPFGGDGEPEGVGQRYQRHQDPLVGVRRRLTHADRPQPAPDQRHAAPDQQAG